MSNTSNKYSNLALYFVNYCNTQINNETDCAIARTIILLSNRHVYPTIDELAEICGVSTATISRFIKKTGYESYSEFRREFGAQMEKLRLRRSMQVAKKHKAETGTQEIFTANYQRITENMARTHENIGIEELEEAVERMLASESVTFLGDDLALSIFYVVQLNLMSRGVPSFLFKSRNLQEYHMDNLREGDTIVYINAYAGYMREYELRMIREAHTEKGVYTIAFLQDGLEKVEGMFDQVILYGEENMPAEGFGSMYMLSVTLTDILGSR